MIYMDRKMPPKMDDITRMNTESRLTETSACFTSGVIPVSGLFISVLGKINQVAIYKQTMFQKALKNLSFF